VIGSLCFLGPQKSNRVEGDSARLFTLRSAWIASGRPAGSQGSGAYAAADRYITLGKGSAGSVGKLIAI
jgi:hypothetical protein